MRTFRDVLAAWQSLKNVSDDTGYGLPAVRKWWQRNSIPAAAWTRIEASAHHRRIPGITVELLARIAAAPLVAPPRSEPPAETRAA